MCMLADVGSHTLSMYAKVTIECWNVSQNMYMYILLLIRKHSVQYKHKQVVQLLYRS